MASYEPILGLLLAFGFFAFLSYLGHREKRRRPMHDRPGEIDAEYGVDYRGPGRKGEKFFAPGGVMFLVSLVVTSILAMWLSDLFRPLGKWAAAAVRRLSN